jgi:dihydrodipicolinate reductase
LDRRNAMGDIRVVVSGTGKMGREVAAAVLAEPGMTPVAFVDGLAETGALDGLPLYADAEQCFAAVTADVVIDFTNAAWTPVLAKAALAKGAPGDRDDGAFGRVHGLACG